MILNFKAAAIILASATSLVSALPKVTRQGRYLYQEDGTRFFIKGVAYQEQGEVEAGSDNVFLEPSSFTDPLSLSDACTRDVPRLQELGVNAVRVYSVDSRLNHDACMRALNDAGIYTIIDLSLPLNGSIDRLQPAWSSNLLDLYINTIDAFTKYENVLAYNIGNEVVTAELTSVAPFVKAAARDTKAYLRSKNINALVGYAGIDGNSQFSPVLANYMTCDPDGQGSDGTSIDLYGLNTYRWCAGDSISAYSGINSDFSNYNVAAYFSEYGCNRVTPRTWDEVGGLFGSEMSRIWSGGVAFSYFPARSADGEFGMVTVDGNTVTPSRDFENLKTAYGAVQYATTPSRQEAGSSSYGSCPATSSTFAASTDLPPTPNEGACDCLQNALSCRYTPASVNYTQAVGELIGTACTLLDGAGQSCREIGSNTTTSTPFYGRLSGCDPRIKLSYAMSKYFDSQNRAAGACAFGGNGTVNTAAPTSTNAADAAASSCISNPDAVFTPSSAATPGGGNGNGGNNGGNGQNGNGNDNGAESQVVLGLGAMAILAVVSAGVTLF